MKPGVPGAPYGVPASLPGGLRYVATNSPLMVMVMKAWGVTDRQVRGAPSWMMFDPWNLDARAERPSTARELQEMLRALIEERFMLRLRREIRDSDAYVLSLDKSGARLKLSESRESPDTPIQPGDQPGERIGTAVSMSYLCWYLNFTFDEPIVNETGLDGLYDFTLELSAPPVLPLPDAAGLARPDDRMDRNDAMIAALRRIGLKLERRKAPVEFFIVDHVERPSEN